MIGFNYNPNDLFPVRKELHVKSKIFNEYYFTALDGSELKEYASPKYGNLCEDVDKDAPMPLFSIIDFKLMPIRCCTSLILQKKSLHILATKILKIEMV